MNPLDPYDAVVLLSFGGPEAPDEVMPFLRRVTAGREIPDERLAEVAMHYLARGGISPINGQNRALVAALSEALRERQGEAGVDDSAATPLPTPTVVLANRNSEPFLGRVLADLHDEGARRILVVPTSGSSSYSSSRQYTENLGAAVVDHGLPDLEIDKVEPWFGHPGFVDTMAESTLAAVMSSVLAPPEETVVLFVTHSIPSTMDETSGPGDEDGQTYSTQHLAVADRIMTRVHADASPEIRGELVFCSRSGRPEQPWLEPDIGDRLRELATEGVTEVVIVPIGFASDHMEVVNDLDTEALAIARGVGITAHRVPTVGTSPAFVAGLVDLIVARAALARGESGAATTSAFVVNAPHPSPVCPSGCCPNLRQARPALCGEAP